MKFNQPVTILASAARTATGTGDEMVFSAEYNGMLAVLNVTAAATDATDTLDVQVQVETLPDTWTPVVSFTQVLGNGGVKCHVAKITSALTQAMFENGTALTAGNVRNITGNNWRVKWTIVDSGNADQSFTFSVTLVPQ